jgi:hypothetical protein
VAHGRCAQREPDRKARTSQKPAFFAVRSVDLNAQWMFTGVVAASRRRFTALALLDD